MILIDSQIFLTKFINFLIINKRLEGAKNKYLIVRFSLCFKYDFIFASITLFIMDLFTDHAHYVKNQRSTELMTIPFTPPAAPAKKKTKENEIWTKTLNWTAARTQRIRSVYMLIETPTSFRAFPLTLGTRLVKLNPPITNTCTPQKTAAGNVICTDLQWGISPVLISYEKSLNSSISTSFLILRLYLRLWYSSPPRLPPPPGRGPLAHTGRFRRKVVKGMQRSKQGMPKGYRKFSVVTRSPGCNLNEPTHWVHWTAKS